MHVGLVARRRSAGRGTSDLRRYVAEQAGAEHEEDFGALSRMVMGADVAPENYIGGQEHQALMAALAAGERCEIRFSWLPADHPGRCLGSPGDWGWIEPNDVVTTYT